MTENTPLDPFKYKLCVGQVCASFLTIWNEKDLHDHFLRVCEKTIKWCEEHDFCVIYQRMGNLENILQDMTVYIYWFVVFKTEEDLVYFKLVNSELINPINSEYIDNKLVFR